MRVLKVPKLAFDPGAAEVPDPVTSGVVARCRVGHSEVAELEVGVQYTLHRSLVQCPLQVGGPWATRGGKVMGGWVNGWAEGLGHGRSSGGSRWRWLGCV